MGYDPLLQLLHPEDALEAFLIALERSGGGAFNVVPRGSLTLATILHLAEKVPVPVPHAAAYAGAELLWATGVGQAPAGFVDFARYSFLGDGEKAERELASVRATRARGPLAYLEYRYPARERLEAEVVVKGAGRAPGGRPASDAAGGRPRVRQGAPLRRRPGRAAPSRLSDLESELRSAGRRMREPGRARPGGVRAPAGPRAARLELALGGAPAEGGLLLGHSEETDEYGYDPSSPPPSGLLRVPLLDLVAVEPSGSSTSRPPVPGSWSRTTRACCPTTE
jgi:hypothetical protein